MRRLLLLAPLFLAGCIRRGAAAPKPLPGGDGLTDMLVWAIGVSLVGIAASVAALVWLPTKKLALGSLAGFVAMFVVAVGTKVAQPYLGYVVLGGMLLIVVGAGLIIRKYAVANVKAVAFGQDVAKIADPAQVETIKYNHRTEQMKAGVHSIIERALAAVKS